MLAAFDIGNTNVTIGVFEGEEVRATWRLATDLQRMSDEYAVTVLGLLSNAGIATSDIDAAIMASVVPDLIPTFERLVRTYFKIEPVVVSTGTRTGVRVLYENPRDVGTDRIVDVVAAMHLYGPPPMIIVDFGTATVFDAVSAEGDYLGGALAPGIGIASEALFERAAKLHRVELERPKSAIGKNTVSAIQSGTLVRLRGADRGDGGAVQEGAGRQRSRHRDGWLGGAAGARDARVRRRRPEPDADRAADPARDAAREGLMLEGKRIVLGVCGSIASYKAADIASKLTQAGALVDVILTDAAQRFVTPLTFRALTQRPVYTDMYDPQSPFAEEHVELARGADALVIAPASATTIARMAFGLADDMLALTALATTAPIIVAPAMDGQMWEHPATRANIATLRGRGALIAGPEEGRLASGRTGAGRLIETSQLLGAINQALGRGGAALGAEGRRQRGRHAGADRPGAVRREPLFGQDGVRAGGSGARYGRGCRARHRAGGAGQRRSASPDAM